MAEKKQAPPPRRHFPDKSGDDRRSRSELVGDVIGALGVMTGRLAAMSYMRYPGELQRGIETVAEMKEHAAYEEGVDPEFRWLADYCAWTFALGHSERCIRDVYCFDEDRFERGEFARSLLEGRPGAGPINPELPPPGGFITNDRRDVCPNCHATTTLERLRRGRCLDCQDALFDERTRDDPYMRQQKGRTEKFL